MQLDKGIDIKIGSIESRIFGGPFRKYEAGQRRLVSVKMAREISMTCDINIPTEDYSIPNSALASIGVVNAIKAMANGNDIYAGCMGGIGRTGLFMGIMAKVMFDYTNSKQDPVQYVRANYMSHAIETQEQQEFVRGFDTAPALKVAKELQIGSIHIQVVEKEVVREIEADTFCTRVRNWVTNWFN